MVVIGDRVLLRSCSAAFPAVVCHVTRSARNSGRTIAVRPLDKVAMRDLPPGEQVVLSDFFGKTWRGLVGGCTDLAIGVLVDEDYLSNVTKNLVWRAKVARKFKMFDEMVLAAKELSYFHLDLSGQERDVIMSSFGGRLKEISGILKSLKNQDDELSLIPAEALQDFEEKITSQLLQHCNDAIYHTETHLLPLCCIAESRSFFLKMIGDMAWIASEYDNKNRLRFLEKSLNAYQMAVGAMSCLPGSACSPLTLGITLNLTSFMYYEMGLGVRACGIAHQAVNSASTEALSAESTRILNLLEENLRRWLLHVPLAKTNGQTLGAASFQDHNGQLPPGVNGNIIQEAEIPNIPEAQDHHPILHVPENFEDLHGQLPNVQGLAEHIIAEDAAANIQEEVPQYNALEVLNDQVHGAMPIPVIPRTVPREPQLQLENLPDLDERPGNSRHGKKFRTPMKNKSAQKSKHG